MKQAMLASLVVLAGVDLLVVYLPAYGHEAGLSVRTVGFLLALRAAFSLLARVALGQLAARLPTRRLLLYCLVIPAAAYAVLPLTGNPLPLALLLALVGFWLGAATPLTMAWVSDLAPLGARGTVMAVRISGNRLGQTVPPDRRRRRRDRDRRGRDLLGADRSARPGCRVVAVDARRCCGRGGTCRYGLGG